MASLRAERMTVKLEKNGAVTTVIINRPEVRNAIDQATAQALVEAFEAFDADDEAHVAVLCGEGGYFCAGADLRADRPRATHRTGDLVRRARRRTSAPDSTSYSPRVAS